MMFIPDDSRQRARGLKNLFPSRHCSLDGVGRSRVSEQAEMPWHRGIVITASMSDGCHHHQPVTEDGYGGLRNGTGR